jgi:hypothetical protein
VKKAEDIKSTISLDDAFGIWKKKKSMLAKVREQQWEKEKSFDKVKG